MILSLHGGNDKGSVVLSRSGSALYTFTVKLVNSSDAAHVTMASHYFSKTLAAIIQTSRDDPEDVIAPYDISFQSNIFKVSAFGSAKISVRFNSLEKFEAIDKNIRRIVNLSHPGKKLLQVQFEGGMRRPPMVPSEFNQHVYDRIHSIADAIDIRITAEHRWSSADICNIKKRMTKIDGLGPVGGFDNNTEHILRHSLGDRSLLLAMLLKKE